MNIALLAQDRRRELVVQFCASYCGILTKHNLCSTAVTGKMVCDGTGLSVQRLMNMTDGGNEQISAKIANNEVDLLLYFRDPAASDEANKCTNAILRLCDVHNIPYATNIVMAELLIKALERGEFDWTEQYISHAIRKKRAGYNGLY